MTKEVKEFWPKYDSQVRVTQGVDIGKRKSSTDGIRVYFQLLYPNRRKLGKTQKLLDYLFACKCVGLISERLSTSQNIHWQVKN